MGKLVKTYAPDEDGNIAASKVAPVPIIQVIKAQNVVMEILGGEMFTRYVNQGQRDWGLNKLPLLYLSFSDDASVRVMLYEYAPPDLTVDNMDEDTDGPRNRVFRLPYDTGDTLHAKAVSLGHIKAA